VVAKILSRSSSWGRSIDDFHRWFSCTMGAVRERPVWARLFGVTASRSGWGVGASFGEFNLTDAGGEVFAWASGVGDMGSTLIRPSGGHLVAGWVADMARRALTTLARMWSLGAAENTAEGQQGRVWKISVQAEQQRRWADGKGCRPRGCSWRLRGGCWVSE